MREEIDLKVETFAGTVAEIDADSRRAWVDGERSDYDDTVEKIRVSMEHDQLDDIEGATIVLAPSYDELD